MTRLTRRALALGLAALPLPALAQRAPAAPLSAADKALAEHPVSFATLSIDDLLREGGYLSELARRGYVIQAPGEGDEEEDEAAVPL